MPIARRIAAVLPLGGTYFLAAAVSLYLTRYDGGVAFLWFAAAILIADLKIRSRTLWLDRVLICALASALATGLFGIGWHASIPFAIINMAEALVGAEALRRAHALRVTLGSLAWMLKFVGPVGIAAPLAATLLVAIVLPAFHLPASSLLHVFVGHSLGNLTFTPLAILVKRGGLDRFLREFRAGARNEKIVLLGLVAVVTLGVFSQQGYPLLFLPTLPIILVSFRLGYGGGAIAVGLVAVIGGALTLAGHGPINVIHAPLSGQLQFFQFYLASMVLTALPVAADLQNRATLHRKLRLSEERYRLLAEHSSDILLHLDVDGTVLYVSPSVRQLSGHDPDELIRSNALRLVAPEHSRRVRQEHLITFAAQGATHSFDYLAMTRGGERRWFETHARAVIGENGRVNGLLCVVRDISARKATEAMLSHAALTDALTGLPNRRAFEAAVEQRATTKAVGEEDCVALFDIDRFKRVNDRFGHDAGDAVLRTFAQVMRSVVREGDVIARMGGEEFAVLFPGTGIPQALMICERLRETMAATATMVAGEVLHVTVSGGVALLGPRGLEMALKQADRALYTAKRGGRDQMALAA